MLNAQTASTATKAVSIVMAVHNQAQQLAAHMPLMLTFDYEPGYEVIVVDESSTDDTSAVLKQLKQQYPRLYTTYIPGNSHYLSRRKLALTIGIKAAHHEWIVITEADCHPEHPQWLTAFAQTFSEQTDAVGSYTPYDGGSNAFYSYLRMITFWRQGAAPYRYDGACLAIRRSAFMQRNGFLANLPFLRSEYDFLMNETPRQRVAVANSEGMRLIQQQPSRKEWEAQQLFHQQCRSHMKRAFFPRLCFLLHQLLLHAAYWTVAAAAAWALWQQDMLTGACSAAVLIVLVAVHTYAGHRLAELHGEHISLWKTPLVSLGVAWYYVIYRLRYLFANKNDFVRK